MLLIYSFKEGNSMVRLPDVPQKRRQAAYEQYFEGYVKVKIPKKRGKGFKTKRIYTDFYYVHDMTDTQWRLRKLLFAGLAVLAGGLYIFAALVATGSNHLAPVGLAGGLSAAALVAFMTHIISYLFCRRKMTVYTYKHISLMLITCSGLAAICLVCVAVASFVCLFFIDKVYLTANLLACIAYLLSACCTFSIRYVEKNTAYREELNDTDYPFEIIHDA